MGAPSIEVLAWIADQLGLPFAVERAGRLELNRAAEDVHPGASEVPDLATLLPFLAPAAQSAELLRVARAQGSSVMTAGPAGRILVVVEADNVAALCIPGSTEDHARRADLVDLAAGVSHELSNALSAIAGWARVAKDKARAGAPVGDALDLMSKAARSAERTARHFLSLARGEFESVVAEPLDVSSYAADVVKLLEPKGRASNVRVALTAEPNAWAAGRSPDLLTVLWNLVQNAMEASPESATVRVQVVTEANEVRLSVIDQGPGISEEIRARIFEPYFTTKSKGTGLGLALVKRAVERLGGRIDIGNAASGGALISVWLPKQDTPSRSTDSMPAARALRILVVDDDAGVRDLVATVLTSDGHTVETASTAEDALAHTQPFDVAVVDVGLEGTRGDVVARQLKERGLVRKIALMSGAAYSASGGHAPPDAWIRKPFELEDLRNTLARLAESIIANG